MCLNFGRPASKDRQPRGPGASGRGRESYRVRGDAAKLALYCNICGEILPLKSNLAIKEELDRLSEYLESKQAPPCPDELEPLLCFYQINYQQIK